MMRTAPTISSLILTSEDIEVSAGMGVLSTVVELRMSRGRGRELLQSRGGHRPES